jgi:large subunit ribosomal protein L4
MAVVDVVNIKGEKVSETELNDSVFNVEVNKGVLHEIVRMQEARHRSGTASSKQRSDVRGSTRKLYRQKGTGRARRGSIKSPLLRGGGVVFGPQPREYGYTPPKKVRRLALRMALSDKFRGNEIMVIDKCELDQIKTKRMAEIADALNIKKALFITDSKNEKMELSARNIPGIKVMRVEGLNVRDILKHDKLVLLEPSIKKIEGRLMA